MQQTQWAVISRIRLWPPSLFLCPAFLTRATFHVGSCELQRLLWQEAEGGPQP